MIILDNLADWRLRRSLKKLKARYDQAVADALLAQSRRLVAEANYARANRAVAALQAAAVQQERSTARMVDGIKEGYLRRIAELEEQLRQADADNAELSGRLADDKQKASEQ